MTDGAKPISVTILDKEYLVGCPDEDRESLFFAVEYLNHKLRELKEKGKIIGAERVAVMTALNIAHEFQEYKRQNEVYTVDTRAGIKRIEEKIARTLRKKEKAKEAREKEPEVGSVEGGDDVTALSPPADAD
jgi:cell division protein ZapA